MVRPRDLRKALGAEVGIVQGPGAGKCKLCGSRTIDFDLVDFNKCCSTSNCYPFGLAGVGVVYVRCENCEFIFTRDLDDWSKTDFTERIYNADYIKVDGEYATVRPQRSAAYIAKKLEKFRNLRFLDYGSGSSIFENEMRASGFRNVVSFDPYSSPTRPEGLFDVVTGFEVIEHCVDPIAALVEIGTYLKPTGIAVIQTGLQPEEIHAVRGRWWYIAPRNGHISIFSLRSLAVAGERAGLSTKVCLDSGSADVVFCRAETVDEVLSDEMFAGHSEFFHCVTLCAPGGDGEAGGASYSSPTAWHGIERRRDGCSFRWSRNSLLRWEILMPKAAVRLDIEVPIVMEITPGFLSDAILTLDGRQIPTRLKGGRLRATASASSNSGRLRIELRTREPMSPAALGDSPDGRSLGIAVTI